MMAKQSENMFGSFGPAVRQRQQEQERIEAQVTGQAAPAAAEPKPKPARSPVPGRPRKRQDATSMTISISQADKDLVKRFAFEHAVTVSDLIHMSENPGSVVSSGLPAYRHRIVTACSRVVGSVMPKVPSP